jgi:SAM-dependent methyltransferase
MVHRLEGANLLDIGCGNKPYEALLSNVDLYVGVDISSSANAADVVAHACHLPFRSSTFDSVLCSQVLEHVEQPETLIKEAYRVLKPGGRILLTAPMCWRHHEEPYDFFRFTRHGLRYLLESAGFETETLEQQGGAWRVVGQTMANALQSMIQFRTFGLRALLLTMVNTMFSWLDGLSFQTEDTCNFAVLARKLER